MKSSPLVIIVPLLIVLIVVGGVFGAKYYNESQKMKTVVVNPTPVPLPLKQVPTGKPNVGFSDIQSTKPVSDLRQVLESTQDSGTSDLDSLAADASAL